MSEQSENQTSTDPSTSSIPPAEGRTDIGEGAESAQQLPPDQAANATTSPTDEMLSKPPTEGRADVAQDLSQEQAASASKDQVPASPSTEDAGATSQAPKAQD